MKYRKIMTVICAGLIASCAAFCPSAFSEEEDETLVRQFSTSPGYLGLPSSDPYGDYQWAFLNAGIFKLVPSKSASAEVAMKDWLEGRGKQTADQNGPEKDGAETAFSVEGIDINVVPAWQKYAGKENKRETVVALIDTGVDYSHEDLWKSVWLNEDEIQGDGIDNDGNGYVDDVFGWNFYSNNNQVFVGAEDNHGTHSAGTIAADKNNIGIAGICDPEYVKIMIVKCLGTSMGTGSPENVAKAIRYAEANGATICNLSFGTKKYNDELYQTMKNSKMLFIVAAGNGDIKGQGYNIDIQPVYPASFDLDNIISVANLQLDGRLDPESNYGVNNVDLAAPGSYILSTVSGNGYAYMSGTSMAAPMVTGAAAMLYSCDATLETGDVKERILSSAKPIDALTGKIRTGGLLDVEAAIDKTE